MADYNQAISQEELWRILNHLHDEIIIYDKERRLVYVNQAAQRHYGKSAEELIGTPYDKLGDTFWGGATIPEVFATKRMVTKRQLTNLGMDVITTSVPILDDDGEVQFVAQNVNDVHLPHQIGEQTDEVQDDAVFLYSSRLMHEFFIMVDKLKNVQNQCLLLGETGTGKSALAKHIHQGSNRSAGPYMSMNCAYVAKDMMEGHLFGRAPCAEFPEGTEGLVQKANGGVLFLDEISEMPLSMQVKLLRLLREKEYVAVGGIQAVQVDVRVIASATRSLRQMTQLGTMREDLYYQLSSFELTIPPLRDRPVDVDVLVQHYLTHFNQLHGKNHAMTQDAKQVLLRYSWPGNVRELSHVVERLVVFSAKKMIRISDLPKDVFDLTVPSMGARDYAGKSLEEILEAVERDVILETMKTESSSVKVAKALGLSQSKAYRMIQKYAK